MFNWFRKLFRRTSVAATPAASADTVSSSLVLGMIVGVPAMGASLTGAILGALVDADEEHEEMATECVIDPDHGMDAQPLAGEHEAGGGA